MHRRHFLSSFTVAAAAGTAVFAANPARAISLEPAPAHLRLSAPSVEGALDWDLLGLAGETRFVDGAISRFPEALRQLDGQEVRITGYMMPFQDGEAHEEFLLGALQFHCVSCMASDLSRLIAVRAKVPVTYSERPVLLRGILRLLEDAQSPLYYRLDAAQPA
ncbi:hypothetical protein [uncultured Ferrovibrio sp.]|jgi:hypothetical protein|uniref:hypothetical protein n=1 Tax=uncultured Ferrovibrio sp. TaxID=1576913 RepID=UPI00262B74A9|nr:hypothetical protein [uncultured Ferrovibrio sp.]